MIRVLFADDSDAVRQSSFIVFQPHVDIDLVGLVAEGLEAVQRVQELAPHVVIMDITWVDQRQPVVSGKHYPG